MTRFARAKGSKASNERREEEATPWHVMRQQLAEQINSFGAQNETNSSYNLKEILSTGNNSQKEEVWCEFGEPKLNKKGQFRTKTVKEENINKNHSNKKVNHVDEPVKSLSTGGSDTKSNLYSAKKKRKLRNKDSLTLSYEPLEEGTTQTAIVLPGNKFIVEDVKTVNNVFKRKSVVGDVESKLKTKKHKFDNENQKSTSKNTDVIKKNKNNRTHGENGMEIRNTSNDGSTEYLCSSEKPSTNSKKTRISETSENQLPGKKNLKKTKAIVEKTQNNINELSKPNKNVSNSFELSHNEAIPEDNSKSPSTKQKRPGVSTSNNDYFNTMGNQDYHKYPYKKNSYSNVSHNNSFQTIIANGREIHIVQYQGFFVKKDDAEELKRLRKKLMAQQIPKDKREMIMKLERRKAEKSLAREKKKVCYHCRQFGHNFSDCPDIKESDMVKTGVCFKCGSLEHSHFECKVLLHQEFRHAVCFVCKEQGHIARQCPLNSQGLYPKGGSCHLCGEVTHLRKDCPKAVEEKTSKSVTVDILKEGAVEDITRTSLQRKETESKKKVIKFK